MIPAIIVPVKAIEQIAIAIFATLKSIPKNTIVATYAIIVGLGIRSSVF